MSVKGKKVSEDTYRSKYDCFVAQLKKAILERMEQNFLQSIPGAEEHFKTIDSAIEDFIEHDKSACVFLIEKNDLIESIVVNDSIILFNTIEINLLKSSFKHFIEKKIVKIKKYSEKI